MQLHTVALCASDHSDEERTNMLCLFAAEALRRIKVPYTQALAEQLIDHMWETMPASNKDQMFKMVLARLQEDKKRKRDEPVSVPPRNVFQRVLRATALWVSRR
jgi:hypothetical protein